MADWLEVRFPGTGQAPPTAGAGAWELELAGGMWLPGEPAGGSADLATWRLPSGLELRVDSLWISRLACGPLRRRAAAAEDLLWLRTPAGGLDRRSGWLVSWNAEGLGFEDVAGPRLHPWDRIAALQVVEDPVPLLEGGCWVTLRSGGHFLALASGAEDGALRLELPWGEAARVPFEEVAAIRRRGAPFLELAAALPAAGAATREGAVDWSPRLGRSVEGRPLRVGGAEYPTGFGTRIPSELGFDLPGSGVFLARAGVDDEVTTFRASRAILFRVLLDDEELARAGPVWPGEAARLFRAEVPRGGRLRLVAQGEGAMDLGLAGHADWLDPVFLPALERD